jgi:lactaldehyde dehydrogenase / glycolaldehyde dehydrogenase
MSVLLESTKPFRHKESNVSTSSNYQNYVAGEFRTNSEYYDVENPATQELVDRAPVATMDDVEAAVTAARDARTQWAQRPAIERAGYLTQFASLVRQNADELARLLVMEQSKTQGLAAVEVSFTADYLDYMAGWARRLEGEILPSDRAGEHIFVMRKPLGVVAGILPWNFPFFLLARKMAPALVTGNTCVIKPSSQTPLNALAMARLIAQTDLPAGVFNLLSGRGDVGAALSAHQGVDMISFTGSVEIGASIMKAASPNITKLNLELGGKAPAIVLADADIDLAVTAIHASRVINTGQVCNCAERVYVQRAVADEFTTKISTAMEATRYGDPSLTADLDMGALINATQLDHVARTVETAVAAGATVVTGGRRADVDKGHHYQPTVLTGCTADMDVMRSEVFGPVLPIQVVDSFDEAIALSNDSEFGLTSSLFTKDLNSSLKGMRELDFGETYINRENFEAMQGFHAGTRHSGVGGADGKHGLLEYTRTQLVYIQS